MSWLFQFKGKSKVWWLGYRHNGEQILKSTGHADKAQAEVVRAKVDAMLSLQTVNALTPDVYQQLSGRVLSNATLKDAIKNWLDEAKGATGSRTYEKYEKVADELQAYVHATAQGPQVSEVTREQLQSFLAEKRSVVSASTVNTTRKCLSVFFRRCKVNGLIRDNPMEGVRRFKSSREEQRVRRPFKLAELTLLYAKAPDDFWRYMVVAGFFTGLRLGDLVTMPIGAVDLKAGTINLTTRKTGAPMHIPMAAPLKTMLRKLISERKGSSPTDPFWPDHAKRYEESGSGWFSQRFYDLLLVKAGLVKVRPHRSGSKTASDKRAVNDVSFHCFRHSYVSTLGQNQQVVKALAGHSSDEVNDLYTKVPAEVLGRAIAQLPDITKG